MKIIILITSCGLNILSLLLWAKVMLILLEVVVCRDVRHVEAKKLLATSWRVRWRLFKRSMRGTFYFISFVFFISAFVVVVIRVHEMGSSTPPTSDLIKWFRVVAGVSIPYGLSSLYTYLGYKSSFIETIKAEGI